MPPQVLLRSEQSDGVVSDSGAPARALIVCTPAGFERYFARMAAKSEGVDPPDWALQEIPEVVRVGPQMSAPQSAS